MTEQVLMNHEQTIKSIGHYPVVFTKGVKNVQSPIGEMFKINAVQAMWYVNYLKEIKTNRTPEDVAEFIKNEPKLSEENKYVLYTLIGILIMKDQAIMQANRLHVY